MTSTRERMVLSAGRVFYGLGIACLGLQAFYNADFVPVILPSMPQGIPGRLFWSNFSGMLLLVTGLCIVVNRAARAAALVLGPILLACLLLRHIPLQLMTSPGSLGTWNQSFKILTLAGGAFVVAATSTGKETHGVGRWYILFGNFSLAITCATFGTEHLLYGPYVAPLVPGWIPWHLFWTYFCGTALIAAGVGMILRIKARLAARLLGSMILIWFLVLHIPRALTMPYDVVGNEWSSVFESLLFSGIAIMLSNIENNRS